MNKATEDFWNVAAKDGATIYGVSNTCPGNKNAVVFVHGITRNAHDGIFQQGAAFFPPKGYDTIRFHLYYGRQGGRKLSETQVSDHVNDYLSVVEQKTAHYDHVFAVGHSFGGPIALTANHPKIEAYSLWDPSFDTSAWSQNMPKIGQYYVLDAFGQQSLCSAEMVRNFDTYDKSFCEKLAKNASAPIQVISAGSGDLGKKGYSYHSFATVSRKDIVAGADHLFSPQYAAKDLCHLSDKWFKAVMQKTAFTANQNQAKAGSSRPPNCK